MTAESIRLIPSILLVLLWLVFIADAIVIGRRAQRARELDPSLALIPVDNWPPEVLENRR